MEYYNKDVNFKKNESIVTDGNLCFSDGNFVYSHVYATQKVCTNSCQFYQGWGRGNLDPFSKVWIPGLS